MSLKIKKILVGALTVFWMILCLLTIADFVRYMWL